jgi:thiopurine S-methyltransferase
MEASYWHGRWNERQIGFHEGTPNAWLAEHVAHLGPGPGRRVLVPLCGKTVDLAFLAAHGFEVLGVELVRSAVDEFFAEAGLTPTITEDGPYVRLAARGIEIVVGDFFALDTARVGAFDTFYDRAAVVALPPPLRERYAATLAHLVKPGAPGLTITFEHDGPTDLPPFSVSAAELARLWPTWTFAPLGSVDALLLGSVLAQRGAKTATEHAYAVSSAPT